MAANVRGRSERCSSTQRTMAYVNGRRRMCHRCAIECRRSCVYNVCMPRKQVYLPADLDRALHELGLSPSELLQEAVRAEVRRRSLIAALDTYLEELEAEVGAPSPEDEAWAKQYVDEVRRATATAQAEPVTRSRQRTKKAGSRGATKTNAAAKRTSADAKTARAASATKAAGGRGSPRRRAG